MKALRSISTVVLLAVVACADPPAAGEAGPPNAVPEGVPDVAELVCEADGSTTVRTPKVVVQPDGIHVHVVSRLDEPASVGLFGRDVEPGQTDFVSVRPPGHVNGACYPFSEHDSGEEPPTSTIDVLDPGGVYTSDEVECDGMLWAGGAAFGETPRDDLGPVPLDAARAWIEGLQPGDEVSYSGYPEDIGRDVIVRRDGDIVARFDFVTMNGERWFVGGFEVCQSSGIRHRD
jgi:hypothetical protein